MPSGTDSSLVGKSMAGLVDICSRRLVDKKFHLRGGEELVKAAKVCWSGFENRKLNHALERWGNQLVCRP